MKLQYEFVRTDQGWDQYAAAREKLAARLGGLPPDTFPGTPDHPWLQFIRRLYFYDPAPTPRQLQVPTLALFGELDNNILAEKNRAAWEAALKAGGNGDYTLLILPKANHAQWEAKIGNNAEMASSQRFVPAYFTTTGSRHESEGSDQPGSGRAQVAFLPVNGCGSRRVLLAFRD